MTEEEKIFAGKLFAPGDEALRAIKQRTHDLCTRYNQTFEGETALRSSILNDIFGAGLSEGCFFQGPIFIHYGCHTKIGRGFFGNFNLTIQDDTHVTIGEDCSFGPNVTIVTPVHPLLPEERKGIDTPEGKKVMCYAKPVTIGDNCWLGAGVTVCPGVTIGENCVIGAGSVVTRDIPAGCFAAGVPCKAVRKITQADSVLVKPGLL